jgi:hypothetical protein
MTGRGLAATDTMLAADKSVHLSCNSTSESHTRSVRPRCVFISVFGPTRARNPALKHIRRGDCAESRVSSAEAAQHLSVRIVPRILREYSCFPETVVITLIQMPPVFCSEFAVGYLTTIYIDMMETSPGIGAYSQRAGNCAALALGVFASFSPYTCTHRGIQSLQSATVARSTGTQNSSL